MLAAAIGPHQRVITGAIFAMPSSPSGSRRNLPHVAETKFELLPTNDVIRLLRGEGFFVTRRMIDHAVALRLVPAPQKIGGWRRWSSDHLTAIREYLLTRSRKQASELDGGRR